MNKQKKEQLNKMEDNCVTTKTITTSNEIGSLSTTFKSPYHPNVFVNFIPGEAYVGSQVKPQQEKNMYIDNDPARSRLHSRAIEAHHEHNQSLRQIYFMDDHDVTMWSVEDAINAIKADKFIYRHPNDMKKPKSYYYNGLDIRFRDPDHPEDRLGFEKAKETFDEHYETVFDHITISDAKDALKKVDAFREHK